MGRRKSFVPDPKLALPPISGEEILEQAQESRVQFLCRAHADDAVRVLLEKATGLKRVLDANEDGYFEVEMRNGKPVKVETSASSSVKSAMALLEQGFGRPTQRVDHTGDRRQGGLVVLIQQVSDGTVRELNPALEARMIEDRSS